MVHKVDIYTRSCPYCGATISREYYSPNSWGMKFGRCLKCKKIFRTGKMLYSDLSYEDRMGDRKEFLRIIAITIPLFILTLIITIYTGWELVGVLAFLSFVFTVIASVSQFSRTQHVLSKYSRLATTDPELFQLEYDESLKLVDGQSINEIEKQIRNTIEQKIIRYILCFILSIFVSEFVLMLLVGDSIEGGFAIALLFVVTTIVSFLLYFLENALSKRKRSWSY